MATEDIHLVEGDSPAPGSPPADAPRKPEPAPAPQFAFLFDDQDGPLSRLAPRQQRAVELHLEGYSVVATAKLLGVDRATVHRWKRDPVFLAALQQGERELRSWFRRRKLGLVGAAFDALEITMQDPYNRNAVKAAEIILKANGLDEPDSGLCDIPYEEPAAPAPNAADPESPERRPPGSAACDSDELTSKTAEAPQSWR